LVFTQSSRADFDTLTKHDNKNLDPTVRQVQTYTGSFVTASEVKRLDWNDFVNGLNELDSTDLLFDTVSTSTISPDTATVASIVEEAAIRISTLLNITIDTDNLQEKILTTFTTLKDTSEHPFLQWIEPSSEDPTKSAWEYRLLVSAAPKPAAGQPDSGRFYSLVCTIKLEALLVKRADWWNVGDLKGEKLTIVITGLELVVKDSFKAPTASK
jgi:hypothetical protein